MRINHNLQAMGAHRNLGLNNNASSKNIEKLSTGFRINRASDDAAGLAISEKMRGQIRGLNQASRNSQDGISVVQTAEGALNETHSIIQRMRQVAVQSANDSNTDVDRESIQDEIDQLTSEIDRIANTTEFNTKKLLNGDLKGGLDEIELDGSLKAEGSFENGSVILSTGSSTSLAFAGDDIKGEVYRIRIVRDVSAGGTISTGDFTTSQIFTTTNLSLTTGDIVISNGVGNTSVGSTSASGDMTVKLDISNGGLKAGDVITIAVDAYRAESTTAAEAGARFQIGSNAGQEMQLEIGKMTSDELGIRNGDGDALSLTSQEDASLAIEQYNMALEDVSAQRASLGAVQNRLEHTIKNLDTTHENVQAAESRIRDVDMAKEMMSYTKNNILKQAAQSMLAQANQNPQSVLQLLQ